MSVDQIMAEAASLPLDQRQALVSRLLALGQGEREADFRRMATAGERSVFERLQRLSVNDPASPTDLATNPAHMEDLGCRTFADVALGLRTRGPAFRARRSE